MDQTKPPTGLKEPIDVAFLAVVATVIVIDEGCVPSRITKAEDGVHVVCAGRSANDKPSRRDSMVCDQSHVHDSV